MAHKDPMGDRLKLYEKELEHWAPNDKFIVLRVDGRGFSKYTKKFEKPFSEAISDAMRFTAENLQKEFSASLAYTQSDEITVIIAPKIMDNGEYAGHMFNGRTQKLASLAGSIASVSFDRMIGQTKMPMFDARVMFVDEHEAANALYWRFLDCKKNATSCLYRYTLGHKKMQNLKAKEMRLELGEEWSGLEWKYKYGVFIGKDGVSFSYDIGNVDHAHRVRMVKGMTIDEH